MQRLNWHRGPGARAKIRQHWKTFRLLWRNFKRVAAACRANGGRIALEWPRSYAYWRVPSVRRFLRTYGLSLYDFDGCALRLRSRKHGREDKFLRKPWRICADVPQLRRLCRKCDHPHEMQVLVESSDTRWTEGYTDELAREIHSAWSSWADAYARM